MLRKCPGTYIKTDISLFVLFHILIRVCSINITNTNGADILENYLSESPSVHLSPESIVRFGTEYLNITNLEAVNLNVDCKKGFRVFAQGYESHQSWALRLIDATGKPGVGLLMGHMTWLGQYDECKEIKFPVEDGGAIDAPNYCWADLLIPIWLTKLTNASSLQMSMRRDYCLPPGCKEHDLKLLIPRGEIFQSIIDTFLVNVECEVKPTKLTDDGRLQAGVAVLAVFALLMLGGTILEIRDSFRSGTLEITEPESVNIASQDKEATVVTAEDNKYDNLQEEIQGAHISLEKQKQHKKNTKKISSRCFDIGKRLLRAFALYSNISKIMCTEQKGRMLGCLTGIRVLSTGYIILGHLYLLEMLLTGNQFIENEIQAIRVRDTPLMHITINYSVAVDTFLVISGLLATYNFLRQAKRRGNKVTWGSMSWHFFHRYWRLTPPYAALVILLPYFMAAFANGPMWNSLSSKIFTDCYDTWWWHLLYIDNFATNHYCMNHTWYMALDMQCFLAATFVLLPLAYRKIKIGFGIIAGLILCHIISTVVIMVDIGGGSSLLERTTLEYEPAVYGKPYTRVGAYVIGIVVGYLLQEKKKARIKPIVVVICWLLALFLVSVVVFVTVTDLLNEWPLALRIAWEPFKRLAWSSAIAWIILACCWGYGGFVNDTLSWSVWFPMAKLSYCVYLYHIFYLTLRSYSSRQLLHYDSITMTYLFLASVTISFIGAIPFCVLFEQPFIAIENTIIRPRKKY